MPVKENPNTEAKVPAFDPKTHSGFHVMRGDELLGTYETEADAQMFIDGHLSPQKIDAKVVEGHDPEPTEPVA